MGKLARPLILAALTLSWGSGCATVPFIPHFVVQVDSISAPEANAGQSYVLRPAREGVASNDLQYREFAAYVHRALAMRGFTKASLEEADTIILLNYGIGEPENTNYSYSLPVYGQTGGGTATYSGSTYGSGGYSHTTGTIQQQPTYGVVGTQTYSGTRTSYFRYLILDAVDLSALREAQEIVPVWKTTITSRGASGDLRRVFPVLIGAAAEHVATNTGQQVHIRLYEGDERVDRIKVQEVAPPAGARP